MTTAPARPDLPARTAASRLIVVLRAPDVADYAPVLDALAAAGVTSVELTLTTPGTLEALPRLVGEHGGTLDIGLGTVTRAFELERAAAAGADYAVTPITRTDLLTAALDAGIPLVPGGLTPTELHAGWSGGAAAVKVFPAGQVGPGYVADLSGPFPDLRVIPSGGVDLEASRAWLDAGAVAVSVGGPLLGDALRGGSLRELTARARDFVAACAAPSSAPAPPGHGAAVPPVGSTSPGTPAPSIGTSPGAATHPIATSSPSVSTFPTDGRR